eukprot:TRINITY_DN1831_c0_g1_i2.p2 TRINITY_DN1831_c0_g1~~TRINITY_DN1831_c0_g1_i2.p2  ORF type:complete len:160 (+),score=23.32 TRINITY_DN1831_c0_g1_i2:531-1010(+)
MSILNIKKELQILMADGTKEKARNIKVGDRVSSGSRSSREVVKVVATTHRVRKAMVRLGDFYITRGHPVLITKEDYDPLPFDEDESEGGCWVRPDEILNPVMMDFDDGLYNFVLDEEHTVLAGESKEFICCTLGKDCGIRIGQLNPVNSRLFGPNGTFM